MLAWKAGNVHILRHIRVEGWEDADWGVARPDGAATGSWPRADAVDSRTWFPGGTALAGPTGGKTHVRDVDVSSYLNRSGVDELEVGTDLPGRAWAAWLRSAGPCGFHTAPPGGVGFVTDPLGSSTWNQRGGVSRGGPVDAVH